MKTSPFLARNIGISLTLLFIVIYLLPLNARQLGVPDEMRYAEIAREMLTTGDFVVPRLNGLRYFEKPAGGHVLNAAAMAVFGETNFAVRLMSALATGLGAWALFLLVRRERDRRAAALTALIFLTCTEVMGIGTYSVLDSMVTGFITLTLCSLYAALQAIGKKKIGLLALAGGFAGGAFLVKGFIALAVPTVVVVPYLLIRRQWKQLFILPWIPLIAALAVSLPWCLAVAGKEADFWHYFFWEEHIRRFFSQEHAQHENPFWYFIPVFLGGAVPWILIAPLPLRNLIRTRLKEPLIQFGLCWLIAPFLFFSASSGKLGTYILPCFAPFALLLAVALSDRIEKQPSDDAITIGTFIFSLLPLLGLIALLVIGGLNFFGLLPPLDPHFALKFIGMLVGLSLSLHLAITAVKRKQELHKVAFLGLSAAALFISIQLCAPTEISPSLGIQGFLKSEQAQITPSTILVANPKTVHALCYVYKRDDIYLFGGKGELTYGVSYPDSAHRYLDIQQLNALLHQRGNRRVVIAMKSRPDDSLRTQLPKPQYQRQWLKIWFAVYEPLTPHYAEE
ncbi:phospholipid carrier-dependent glycosyltransferase [Pontiella sp.]|uniref:phospholipid carrier-dependent glycosyltransferase n=1 Tax=Pontiella sp. TaxID=2837462 RepID=UPI0035677E26